MTREQVFAVRCKWMRLILRNWLFAGLGLVLLVACVQHARAADPYVEGLDKRFSAPAPNPSANADAWRDKRHFSWVAQEPESSAAANEEGANPLVLCAVLAVGSLVLGLTALLALRRYNQWQDSLAAKEEREKSLMAEDPSMVEFLRALHEDPLRNADTTWCVKPASPTPGPQPGVPGQSALATDASEENLAAAAKNLVALWASFQKTSRAKDDDKCARMLNELIANTAGIKNASSFSGLRPVLLLASALQGLLKQLSTKATNITPSALRTAAAAIDMIDYLTNHPVRSDLVTEPPIRLLVVDDEPISRGVLSSALRKIFGEPDLSPDGKTALVLAEKRHYDLILLDVEMPGLDGFEVCSKIHETAQNFTTPVVFITGHSDFDSRAKSAVAGAHDLMGKPFLAFEITVKALTLVLRTRLDQPHEKPGPSEIEKSCSEARVPDSAGGAVARAAELISGARCQLASSLNEPIGRANEVKTPPEDPMDSAKSPSGSNSLLSHPAKVQPVRDSVPHDPSRPSSVELAQAFFKGAPKHLQKLRADLFSAREAARQADRDELLAGIFIGVHSICAEAGRAQLGAAFRVASALEAVLKKIMERPAYCTPSTLHTAAAAIETIDQLCQRGMDLDLIQPPARLLVVDDDPVARRAFSGALQLAIGRPDTADSGEVALELARNTAYDLIFLDVIMPGLDGFAVCSKLLEMTLNRRTPVVFVTNQDDTSSRAKAEASGGCGFIPKPVLPCEILLLAVTSIARGRLERRDCEPREKAIAMAAPESALAS